MLGISGIRGIVGDTLTPHLAIDAAAAFAAHIGGRGIIIVGRDSRPSGEWLSRTVTGALLAAGCDVVDLGVVTTPTVGWVVRATGAAGGIVLTASHNPIVWNGIKFITTNGHAPAADDANAILDRFRSGSLPLADVDNIGAITRDAGATKRHVDAVLATVDAEAIRAKHFRVVLDSVNGAGGAAGRSLLDALGCDVVHLNDHPTGRFAHEPEPIEANLSDLAAKTAEHKAAVGFAQDPDADRLAIVDETGRYIGEEYTLALAARAMVRSNPDGGCIVTNLSTSRMVDDIAAAAAGWRVHRTAVGEANVVEGMLAEGAAIGGEGNGGVIDPRVGLIRDSLSAMALVLELLAAEGKPLSQVVNALPRYAMVKEKEPVDREKLDAALERVQADFAKQRVSTVDGVRVDWPDGWVHVRASNTEPIFRLIAEAADADTAHSLINRVREAMSGE